MKKFQTIAAIAAAIGLMGYPEFAKPEPGYYKRTRFSRSSLTRKDQAKRKVRNQQQKNSRKRNRK